MTKPSYTHLMSDSITQNPAQSMNELDAIAEEAAMEIDAKSSSADMDCVIIRAAIDKALEAVLSKEPSADMRRRGNEAIGLETPPRCSHVYRAMTAQLLKELTQAKN